MVKYFRVTLYGAEAGFALAFAATKGRGLTTSVSSFFGGFASAFLKVALQDTLIRESQFHL